MAAIEYKHVRFRWGLLTDPSKKRFDRELMSCIQRYGDDAWELKGILRAGIRQAHLIFGLSAHG